MPSVVTAAKSKAMRGRATRLLALVLVSLSTLEIVSFGALCVLTGGLVSYGRLQARRGHEVLDTGDTETLPEGVLGDRPVFRADDHVLHPFLGSVRRLGRKRRGGRVPWAVELGFDRSAQVLFGKSPRQQVVVAVFGGSVADIFVRLSGADLAAALEASDRFAGKKVTVASAALGGFKQPQQLMALNFLLVNGARPAIVINIDGFNEVAFPPVDLVPKHVWPFFPRDWYYRVAMLGPKLRLSLGEIAYLRKSRAQLAELFSKPWSRWSFTAGLVWHLLDRRLGFQTTRAEATVLSETQLGDSYQTLGPAWNPGALEDLYRGLARMWWESSVQMQRLSSANGIEYYHFLQPNQYVEGSKPLTTEERRVAYREDHEYRPGVEAGYPELRRIARRAGEDGVSFHDFSYLFKEVTGTLYLDDCCHFNEDGTAILAEAIAEIVARGRDAAEVGSAPFPRTTECGQSFAVDIRMRNTGESTWRRTDLYELGPVLGTKEVFRSDGHRLPIASGTEVAPGERTTFRLELTAPAAPGPYETRWSMMREGTPFGAPISKQIEVRCGS